MAMARYRCITCDHVFELPETDAGKEGVRCPSCHRVKDVVRASVPPPAPWYRSNAVVGGAALVAVGAAVVLVYVLRMSAGAPPAAPQGPTIPAGAPGEVDRLVALLGTAAAAPETAAGAPSAAGAIPPGTADVNAELLRSRTGSAVDRARALGALLHALHRSGRLEWVDVEAPADLQERQLLAPDDALARLETGPLRVTSLEGALLALRLARGAGLDAALVRVERFGTDARPADPSGVFGHFAVAVRGTGAAADPLVDATRPEGLDVGPAETSPVEDGQAGGILEAYRALRAAAPRLDGSAPDRALAQEHLGQARGLAPRFAAVRIATALLNAQEDPGLAFSEAKALLDGGFASEKVAVAELYVGLGRMDLAAPLLDQADARYPGWPRVPVVRAQMALLRATALLQFRSMLRQIDSMPPAQAEQLRARMTAFGIGASDLPEEQFALAARALDDADRRAPSASTDRVRELHAVAFAEFRMATAGDVDGAERILAASLAKNPASPLVAVPLASIRFARDDEEGARGILAALELDAAALSALLDQARRSGDRIRPLLQPRAPGFSPFDLSSPGAALPMSEPSLQMPSLGGHRSGQPRGLQLRF
jgi:DNA-directed RNA polymerase subunit RPC12/RpoP